MNNEKTELQTKFERLYKGCVLYAITLDGFSHSVYYKDADGTRHADKYSAYLSSHELESDRTHVNKNGDVVHSSWNQDKTKVLFLGFPHYAYQNNAKEYVYKDVKEW